MQDSLNLRFPKRFFPGALSLINVNTWGNHWVGVIIGLMLGAGGSPRLIGSWYSLCYVIDTFLHIASNIPLDQNTAAVGMTEELCFEIVNLSN